jgi:NAD(P)H-hydrate epimerase
MKILSSDQIREADQYTIKNQPITSLDLMEQAATRCYAAIQDEIGDKIEGQPIHVFCGIGNNGGDGLVLARLFFNAGFDVNIYISRYSNKSTTDFKVNLGRLKGHDINLVDIDMAEDLKPIKNGWIIDAIFGTGLNRPPRGIAAATIKHINQQDLPIISIDIPSGLFSNLPAHHDMDKTIAADYTFGFQVPKLAFFMPENFNYVGNWNVVDIGLDAEFVEQQESELYYLVPSKLKAMLRNRSKFEHKGDFGHAVIIGGDTEKAGAVVLAGKAALRAGAGLVTLMVPEKIIPIVHVSAPEIMCVANGEDYIRSWEKKKLPKAMNKIGLGVGVGMGKQSRTKDFLKDLLEDSFDPIVLDADAINIIAGDQKLMDEVPAQSILTPHIGEFKRLVGNYKNGFEMLKKQIEFSIKHKVIVVLKGAHTRISTPRGKVFFNPTNNPGLATAGSGDVLTGVITGLLKQYDNPVNAALLGVYLHGKAGDLALKKQSMESLIASDIIDNLGNAYQYLHHVI